MRLITQTKGLKVRLNAVAKLREAVANWEEATGQEIRGTVIANEDGTFTPCVLLDQRQLTLARDLASSGIYVIG